MTYEESRDGTLRQLDEKLVFIASMYNHVEPQWYQCWKRCRAVDCSIAEHMMPEGFCERCWENLQAEKLGAQIATENIVKWLRHRANLPGVQAHQREKAETLLDTAERLEYGEHNLDY